MLCWSSIGWLLFLYSYTVILLHPFLLFLFSLYLNSLPPIFVPPYRIPPPFHPDFLSGLDQNLHGGGGSTFARRGNMDRRKGRLCVWGGGDCDWFKTRREAIKAVVVTLLSSIVLYLRVHLGYGSDQIYVSEVGVR
jgi:hypothetical protein